MVKWGCLIVLVVLIGIPALAGQYLPWWGTLLVIFGELALLFVGLPRLLKAGLRHYGVKLFQNKSRVLHGAMVQIHGVKAVDRPDPRPSVADDEEDVEADADAEGADARDDDEPDDSADDDGGADEPVRYVQVDFTLTPVRTGSAMKLWDPTDLVLVPFDAMIDVENIDTDCPEAAMASAMMVDPDTGQEHEDFAKIEGAARLRAVFACPMTLRGRVKLRYYFEQFGDLLLPEA